MPDAGYYSLIERQKDGGFVAWVPDLPGVITSGRTEDEVIRKLAAMWDPWEDGNTVRRMHPTGGTHSIVGSSPRATRWHDYTREEREVLYDLVQTHRSRHRGE